MKIVFMGTPDFAVPSLEALVAGEHIVAGVFTQPDKPVGRKQILTPPDVKVCAQKYNIPVFQPEKIKGSDSLNIIKSLAPDVIIVIAYGKILPMEILNAAKYGCINVHASILPLYRGAAPIQWSVLNGDEETGVSVMQMDEGIDTGDILLVKKTKIGINETSAELFDRLSHIGADALMETLDKIDNGTAAAVPQPEGNYEYASMINKDISPIDWNKSAFCVHNKVRGLQTWPVAVTTIHGKKLKIHKTELTDMVTEYEPGTVIDSNKKLLIACGDGKVIRILRLQLEGKKAMDVDSFLTGNRIEKGTVLK